jgi:ferric-dicitrate binding protein FerR (iron transport regulator)
MWQDYLSNEMSANDYIEFMQLIKSGDFDDRIRASINDLYVAGDIQIAIPSHKAEELLANIQLMEKEATHLISSGHVPRRRIYAYAAACTILLLATCGWLILREKNESRERMATIAQRPAPSPHKAAGTHFIKLPDGSFVLLNGDSYLDYPDQFAGTSREVTLSGEAYFDIKPSRYQSFIVHTGNISTTVLGTAFNIKAFPRQDQVTVTVTRGKVRVAQGERTYAVILPNQQLSINISNDEVARSEVDADSVVAWKQQYLILNDVTLLDAALIIGDKYHVKVNISDEALKKCVINATFLEEESLDQVLHVICATVDGTYEHLPNDQIIIHKN